MKKQMFSLAAAVALLCASTASFAADEYNKVPASDMPQYNQCLSYVNKKYEGGTEKSPIAGQNKSQAFCTCMWNETADDFKGNLASFSETPKGKKANDICEKYSDWGG